MADRYEQVAAYSTLKSLNQAIDLVWLVSHWLTEYEPRTGQALKIPICGTDQYVTPDGPQLKEWCDGGMVIVDNRINMLQGVLADTGFRDYLTTGLLDWSKTLNEIDIDTNRLNTANTQYVANISEDKEDMDALGLAIQGINFNLDAPPAPLPDDVRILTIIHDLLDASMYNLRCINDANGIAWVDDSIDNVKDHLFQRMKTLNNLRPRAYAQADIAEVDQIYLVADYIGSQYPGITTLGEANILANYIETNIPRLPLLRRYWSL